MRTEIDTLVAGTAPWSLRAIGLSKSYKVYRQPSDLLSEIITGRPSHDLKHALQDVSFTIAPGEVVGVIGPNGAGKSTLLKIVAGTLAPTAGILDIRGKISAILELGTGFHPEYTGHDNIYLGGLCMGMSREQIDQKHDWIVKFAELGPAIHQPFKTYSSGMQARLTFATAISVEPEILIIDEALAAGDAYFVAKCGHRIRQLCESGATVLFVSHSTYQIAALCQRAIWIEDGRVREIGSAVDVCRHYDYAVHERISGGEGSMVAVQATATGSAFDAPAEQGNAPAIAIPDVSTDEDPMREDPSFATARRLEGELEVIGLETVHAEIYRRGPSRITSVRLLDAEGRAFSRLRTWDEAQLVVAYEYQQPATAEEPTLGLSIAINRRHDLLSVAMFSMVNPVTDEGLVGYEEVEWRRRAFGRGVLVARFPHIELLEGEYLLSLGIQHNVPSTSDFHEYHHMRYVLRVGRNGYPSGSIFHPLVEWRHFPR
ncbi:ABC transporter ATP-binding protein [Phreatobacter sp.]|uniref:ABC transporter ATP-binding protein n=1 Tax=Phreatobacter sp. TaxID=1966341 RepID=UPI0022CC2477|nr:ABC transporter ATP-binding protein [Phreatobacter sp.]MCZ8316878.1 ABC transporter ATP-binding protein [Phreatobacter sp.]